MLVVTPTPAKARGPATPTEPSVPVSAYSAKFKRPASLPSHVARKTAWPAAATQVVNVDLAPGKPGAAATVGGLPVTLSAIEQEPRSGRYATTAPAKVKVEVVASAVARAAGAPVALRLARADGAVGGRLNLRLDVTSFREAFGGAYASRLQLRLLPECGLRPVVDRAAAMAGTCAGVDIPTDVDFKRGIVSADIDLGRASTPVVVALASSGSAAGIGTFGKTSLKESYSWTAGTSAGNFTFNYSFGAPPVPGGFVPSAGLSYSSQAVDGQTASQNVQSGLVGEGWNLATGGFIESTFRPCNQDNSSDHPATWNNATGDPCWRHENYQISWAGVSGELVPTGTPNVWRVAGDEGSLVEYITSGLGGLGAHWKVSRGDGTQWFFGRQRLPGWTAGARETNSVLSQEVFANHSGEPCFHASGYTYSHCTMNYRWLLDYAVDPHGNSMSYWYTRFTNLAGSNNSGQGPFVYHRDAVLDRIEYGTRAGNETTATAPAMVEFSNADRCLVNCSDLANWTDTPWDLKCDGAPCNSNLTPTYWTSKRLAAVTTKVRVGTGYKPVDQWNLGHDFPGGTDVPVLWLTSVTRTGFDAAGNSKVLPSLVTYGRRDRNRADYDPNASMADPQKYRISAIDTETGGRIEVSYLPTTEPACTWRPGKTEAEWPNFDHNASRCFQQWVTNRSGSSGWSWWHKFVVDKVTEKDLVGGSPDKVTSYSYSMDGAGSPSGHPLVLWGYSSSVWGTVKKAMSTWKGYPTVVTTVGQTGETQARTKRLYYRGLDRDTGLRLPGEEFFRRATITDSLGATVADHPTLAGQVREEIVYDGETEIAKTIHDPSVWQTAGGALPTWQTPPERIAYMSREVTTKSLTRLLPSGAWRTTETVSTWDTDWGTLTQTNDKGDTAVTGDERCARYSYARNVQAVVYRAGTGAGQVATGSGTWIAGDWRMYDNIFSPGDFNGDGRPDVLARSKLNGNLYLFPGNGSGGFGARAQIGSGWVDADQIFSPGDFDSDGKADVIYRRPSDMNLYMVRGNGTGGWIDGASIQIGQGWNGDRIFSPGDVTGDGKPEVFYRRTSDSHLMYIRGNGAGGWIDGQSVDVDGTSWADRDIVFGRGDVTGDGRTDLYARVAATGELRLYPGNGNGTFGSAASVGTGWKVYSSLLTAGDLNGDAKADVIGRFAGEARLLSPIRRAESVGVACSTTPSYPGDLIADVRTGYDNNAYVMPAMRGLPTGVDSVKSMTGSTVTSLVNTAAGYDQWGRAVWTKDELGRQASTTFTHDAAGLLSSVKVTNPAGHSVTATVEPLRGLTTSTVDANGKTATTQYDALGRPVKQWAANRPVTATPDVEYVYDISKTAASSIATKVLGPTGNQITSYEILDGLLRVRQTQSPAPQSTGGRMIFDAVFDSRGERSRESSFWNNAGGPSGALVTFADGDVATQKRYAYDSAGRLVTDALYSRGSLKWQNTYVYRGDRSAEVQAAGGVTTETLFDVRGNRTEVRHYNGGLSGPYTATTFTYDDSDRMTGLRDPSGNTWSRSFDLLGRLASQSDPDTGTSTYTYDDAGQRLTATDSRNVTLSYEYDSLGRQTKEWKGSTGSGTLLATWTYDTLLDGTVVKGHVGSSTRYHNGVGFTTGVLAYDDAYRRLANTLTVPAGHGELTGTWTLRASYNVDGSPRSVTYPAANGLAAEEVNYTYDTNGFQLTATGDHTYVSGTTFQPWGDVYEMTLGAGTKRTKVTTDEWEDTRRTKSARIATERPGTPNTFDEKLSQQFNWNPGGTLASIDSKQNDVVQQSECFGYDYLLQLNEAWTTTPSAGGCQAGPSPGAVAGPDRYWTSYRYDAVGNRTSVVEHGLTTGDTTSTYTYPAAGSARAHAVSSISVTGPAGNTSASYTYDDEGNTTRRSTGGNVVDLTWTDGGQVASITERQATGDKITSYIYSASGDKLLTKRPDGGWILYLGGTQLTTNAAGALTGVTRYYVCAGRTVASRTNADPPVFLANTHQETAQIAVDSSTLATTVRKFDPYGRPRGTQPAWPNQKGFVGGSDEGSGFVNLGARIYEPGTGHFLSSDKILNVADPQVSNGYAYAANNPTTKSDPSGFAPGSGDAHDTAVVMRAQALMAHYTGAEVRIFADLEAPAGGADLVCWECEPGKVWVWEFKSEGEAVKSTTEEQIAKHLEQVMQSPITKDLKVVPGPTFESIGLAPFQSAPNLKNPYEVVTVRDGAPGLQIYRVDRDDRSRVRDPEFQEIHEANAAAIAKSREATEGGHVKLPALPKDSGPSAGVNDDQRRLDYERRRILGDSKSGWCCPVYNDHVEAAPFFEDPVVIIIIAFAAPGLAARLAIKAGTNTRTTTRQSPPINPRYPGNPSRDIKTPSVPAQPWGGGFFP